MCELGMKKPVPARSLAEDMTTSATGGPKSIAVVQCARIARLSAVTWSTVTQSQTRDGILLK
jgi:hypothetical protein